MNVFVWDVQLRPYLDDIQFCLNIIVRLDVVRDLQIVDNIGPSYDFIFL